jgi:SAM-dependent methyltransferase
MEGVIRGMATNLRLFEKHCTTVPTPTFLDIGSNEGAAMEGMRRRGWQVFGFDVNEHAARPNVIVAPVFRAEIIPMKFGAVMLRGVIENVEEWESLLDETVKCMRNGGVLQVQTPLPVGHYHEFVQCANHLQIFSDTSLQDELEKRNLVILEKLAWGIGQCWIAKKAGRTLIDR